MAVRKIEKNSNGQGSGRVKFRYADSERYVDLDMENANAEVADGIKSLANALSGRQIVSPARALSVPKSGLTVAPPVVDQEEIPFPPHGEVEEEAEYPGSAEASENSNGSGTKRTYNFKTPTFLNDLDVTKAKMDLKEFVAEKNPTEVMSKYLVIVYFLLKYMDIPEVTVDHIYTVFDTLGWKTEMPLKAGKPLADLKSKRHMLTREPGAEGYKLNFKGEQEVEKMGATK
jgi:hypothetical protein